MHNCQEKETIQGLSQVLGLQNQAGVEINLWNVRREELNEQAETHTHTHNLGHKYETGKLKLVANGC